ncbi:SDR family NAD(P)-dependent oxidoreductase [Zhongshania aquimaris]|uniref:SDR family NAD(P)-dependent oxidoreductase n=1 Tax=Zhongshania aquimaris TaxID=2857107 RepID=A0ABS6VWG6_9GAMM|nr:SDR family NAD(P)-dependent oxidoreductase [Zhongshania aquimaris]MBW2942705.1 SDR family NAD(P)-dependent oxidoreductase [Zhongshania aquimaris]
MAELRFDGRVAVITGAGRGLGRSYAELLASRGAKVVVNDPGLSMVGNGTDEHPAEEVVAAIKAAGGEAIANMDSVASPAGGKAIIDTAINTYGRVDILIHNAGNVRRGSLCDLSYEDFEAVLDVHLRGGFHVVREAFPHMVKAGYGRIVLTGSIGGLYGNAGVVNYCMSKAGLAGLSNVAAIEGAAHNIKSNLILPAAVTRMSEGIDTSAFPPMDPELVAPCVAWMAHESCSITGEALASAAGRVARIFPAETVGVYQPSWSIEDVAKNIDAIRVTEDPLLLNPVPAGHMEHLKYSFAMASKSNS